MHVTIRHCPPVHLTIAGGCQTISYADFVEAGGEKKAKELGKVRYEGPTYQVRDGDIMLFHFRK